MTTYRSAAATTTPVAAAPVPGGPVSLDDLAGRPVHGVTLGHPDTAAAEHWLAALPVAPVLAVTHLVRVPRPHVALTLVFADETPAELGGASPAAVAEHVARRSGRAVLYPGAADLVGTLTVGQVLALSAIERVEVLGGGDPDPETLLETNDFVRPHWRQGVLTLTTTPAAGGRLIPFENRNPTPCCAAH